MTQVEFDFHGSIRAVVKWWNSNKGYGFLALDGDKENRDVFIHYTALVDVSELVEGQAVSCEIVDGPKGPQAIKVRGIK